MKFGRAAQLVLAIGIFAVGIIFLYRMNLERQAAQEGLHTQLAAAQLLLPKLTSEKEDLESQLTRLQNNLVEARSAIGEGKSKYPDNIESIEYDQKLFQMAQDRSLEVIRLTASEPGNKNVEDVAFTNTSFEVEVAGEALDSPPADEEEFREYVNGVLIDILAFINGIAVGEEFITATVESVDISVPTFAEVEEAEESEEAEEGEAGRVSATIKLVIYSYEGE